MQNAKRDAEASAHKGEPAEIKARSFEFALRVVKLCQHLDTLKGSAWTLSRQLLRAGTSVGANLQEAQAAHSRADFICKAEIALKEARESLYWLRLIVAAELVPPRRVASLEQEADELTRILAAIVVSAKSHLAKTK
jgi:four helix bundle protein